jgi:hypothetical protein
MDRVQKSSYSELQKRPEIGEMKVEAATISVSRPELEASTFCTYRCLAEYLVIVYKSSPNEKVTSLGSSTFCEPSLDKLNEDKV